MFARFGDLIEQSGMNFSFSIGRSNSMYGCREIKGMCDPLLLLPAPFLKIYPRMLYSYKLIKEPPDFSKHSYYFRYYPRMIVRLYGKSSAGKVELVPATHWIVGTCSPKDDGNDIAYNVAVNVDLRTIVEEELHCQIKNLHETDNTNEVTKSIETQMPDLKDEIVANLNRILSTEEKKFKDLGNIIKIGFASELRILETFVIKFGTEVIQSANINLPKDPTVEAQ